MTGGGGGGGGGDAPTGCGQGRALCQGGGCDCHNQKNDRKKFCDRNPLSPVCRLQSKPSKGGDSDGGNLPGRTPQKTVPTDDDPDGEKESGFDDQDCTGASCVEGEDDPEDLCAWFRDNVPGAIQEFNHLDDDCDSQGDSGGCDELCESKYQSLSRKKVSYSLNAGRFVFNGSFTRRYRDLYCVNSAGGVFRLDNCSVYDYSAQADGRSVTCRDGTDPSQRIDLSTVIDQCADVYIVDFGPVWCPAQQRVEGSQPSQVGSSDPASTFTYFGDLLDSFTDIGGQLPANFCTQIGFTRGAWPPGFPAALIPKGGPGPRREYCDDGGRDGTVSCPPPTPPTFCLLTGNRLGVLLGSLDSTWSYTPGVRVDGGHGGYLPQQGPVPFCIHSGYAGEYLNQGTPHHCRVLWNPRHHADREARLPHAGESDPNQGCQSALGGATFHDTFFGATLLVTGVFDWRKPFQQQGLDHLNQALGLVDATIALGAVTYATIYGVPIARLDERYLTETMVSLFPGFDLVSVVNTRVIEGIVSGGTLVAAELHLASGAGVYFRSGLQISLVNGDLVMSQQHPEVFAENPGGDGYSQCSEGELMTGDCTDRRKDFFLTGNYIPPCIEPYVGIREIRLGGTRLWDSAAGVFARPALADRTVCEIMTGRFQLAGQDLNVPGGFHAPNLEAIILCLAVAAFIWASIRIFLRGG